MTNNRSHIELAIEGTLTFGLVGSVEQRLDSHVCMLDLVVSSSLKIHLIVIESQQFTDSQLFWCIVLAWHHQSIGVFDL